MMEELLREMERYAFEHHVPIINENGRQAFQRIVKECCPHNILEIGTAIGYSALLMMEDGADDAKIVSLELDEDRAGAARRFLARSPYADRISVLVGDAADLIGTLHDTYDFVFIDAAKGQYVDYFKKVLPLLSEHATVLADNVLFRGYVRSKEKPPRRYKTIVKRLREYIELVENTEGFVTEILKDGDGLAVSRRS